MSYNADRPLLFLLVLEAGRWLASDTMSVVSKPGRRSRSPCEAAPSWRTCGSRGGEELAPRARIAITAVGPTSSSRASPPTTCTSSSRVVWRSRPLRSPVTASSTRRSTPHSSSARWRAGRPSAQRDGARPQRLSVLGDAGHRVRRLPLAPLRGDARAPVGDGEPHPGAGCLRGGPAVSGPPRKGRQAAPAAREPPARPNCLPDGTPLPSVVTHADLASLCGGSRENISRILSDLQRRGFVERGSPLHPPGREGPPPPRRRLGLPHAGRRV